MSDPNRDYFEFYLMGRDEAQQDAEDFDVDFAELGKRVLESVEPLTRGTPGGPTVRELAMVTAREESKKALDSMQAWEASSRKLRRLIREAGGDVALAYRLYTSGYIDELAIVFENEILDALVEEEDEDEDEEDGEGEGAGDESADA